MKAKNATFRHKEDGTRLVTATIYSDGLTLPTSPAELGFEDDDDLHTIIIRYLIYGMQRKKMMYGRLI